MTDDQVSTVALGRQRGLAKEMSSIANNIANASTSGYRREGVVFSEYVVDREAGASMSIADLNGRYVSDRGGEMRVTGRALDLAIAGDGYFVLERDGEPILTRAGAFHRSADGVLVAPTGESVLDDAGAAIVLPPDSGVLTVAADGTISTASGPVARIGIVRPGQTADVRAEGAALVPDGPLDPVDAPALRQGVLEGSNVQPVEELARMIEVSRAYEQVQSLMENDDGRLRNALETLGRAV